MSEHDINDPEKTIEVNVNDGAVAVEEKDRTVLLTPNETIIVEKPEEYSIIPNDRPRKVYGGMWGQVEVAALGAGMMVILAAMAVFFFLTLPAKRELDANRARKDKLEQELISARTKYGDIQSTETRVAELVSSVDQFEMQYLPVASNGRTSLYQRLNNLIGAYGLVNTSGPDYAPLEMADVTNGVESEDERGRARFRSLFPGAYVTMTLEGPYQNLRRFIRDVETGNEFVIISSIELEPSDSQSRETRAESESAQDMSADPGLPPGFGRIPGNVPAQRKGRTLGEVVSLRMEMAAYFRRATQPAAPAPGVQQ